MTAEGDVEFEKLKGFADASPHVVWIAAESGDRIYFNAAWTRYTGLTAEQSQGSGWQLALHPADFNETLSRWTARAPLGAPYHVAQRFRSAEGDYCTFSGGVFPQRDANGAVRYWVGMCDRADAVVRADDRFRVLADTLPVLLWTTDADDRLTFVNRAWKQYTGLDAGSGIEERNALVHVDDLGTLLRALAANEREVEFRLKRRKDETYRWHLVRWEHLRVSEEAPFFRIGIATDIHDRRMASDAREGQMRQIAEAIPDVVWSADASGRVDYANSALATYSGRPEIVSGHGWNDIVHPSDLEESVSLWRASVAGGRPFEHKYRLRRHDGAYRWFISRASPLLDEAGSIVRWFGTASDIHEQMRVSIEQTYLAELGRLVSLSSFDTTQTVLQIVRSAVPALADWCQIALLDGTHARSQPAEESNATLAVADALLTRAPQMRSGSDAITVPLLVRGDAMGTISFVRLNGTRYSGDDVPLLEAVARRSAVAIANAQLFEREHRVADAMQAASLPKQLPQVAGLSMDAVYVPAKTEAQVGGDWYDAFVLSDGRTVLSIGDVAGNGLEAAVTMSSMRQVIRGTAQVHADPVLMLGAADRALRLEDPERFVTAFVAVLDPVARSLTYAGAGHPPPQLVRAAGTLDELISPGMPLGLREGHIGEPHSVMLHPGDTLVLYTDGIVEAEKDVDAGIRMLQRTLLDNEFVATPHPAAYLRERLIGHTSRDDVAVLVVRLHADVAGRRRFEWAYDALDPALLRTLREEVRVALDSCGVAGPALESAELILSELAGNVVRHAPGPLQVFLDAGGPYPVLHVLDEGDGFTRSPMLPTDVLSESGRGLYIVSQIARSFSVTRRYPRGSHARAVIER